MKALRRFLSMLLLTAFGLPLFASLLASGQSGEAGLPVCCRRNGVHHCAMSVAERSQLTSDNSATPKWKPPAQRCPYCPATLPAWHHQDTFAAPTGQAIFAGLVSHPSGTVQTESKRRISRDRSRQKRGPPAFSLA